MRRQAVVPGRKIYNMKNTIIKNMVMVFVAVALLGFLSATGVRAQIPANEPPLPALLKTLADEGVQIRYLGSHNGIHGWVTISKGQEQYFYQPPDGRSLLMGILFDDTGKMVTMRQVQALQQAGGEALSAIAGDLPPAGAESTPGGPVASLPEFRTPSEQLMSDAENSNWLALGRDGAPVIYMFIDPQCPHCHAFLGDLRPNYINNGLLQVRIIPVGLRDDSRAQAAFMLSAPDGIERFYKVLDGDKTALPVSTDLNDQGVQRNMAIMQSWKLDVTPLTVYRAADGKVKIVQGRAKDLKALLADLPRAQP